MKYIEVKIDGQRADFNDLPISFNYLLEDPENFQQKKGSESFDVTLPATVINDRIFNTFHNPSVEDLTTGEVFRSHRPCTILGNGYELLSGKCFLTEASHTDRPLSYKINCYGGNADWMIDLKEITLFEVLQGISFTFDKTTIEDSWNYDGASELLPYVFAPVKYGSFLDDVLLKEDNFSVTGMKPSLSLYWTLYKAFKSIGYKLQSSFFNSEYFRRAVMPWVWGSFLSSEGTKYEIHKFKAKSIGGPNGYYAASGNLTNGEYANVHVTNDSTDGMFDNNNTAINGDYEYIGTTEMRWTYNPPHYGQLETTFSIVNDVMLSCSSNSNADVWVRWFKNGVQFKEEKIAHLQAPYITTVQTSPVLQKIVTSFCTVIVDPGDYISAKMFVRRFDSTFGSSVVNLTVMQFQIDYFRIPLGGTISFDAYNGFKKHKFLDLFRGVIDFFNLSIATDSVNKVIVIEPTHGVNGFFNGEWLDWNSKQDLSKESVLSLYSDYEREVLFKLKDDSNDGLLKLIQDRNINKMGAGKYVFPDRFKKGLKEFENRFFSPVMHYEADQFKNITGVSPQLVAIVPENISNTSRSESQNTFLPKLCWYKGIQSGVGGWRWDGIDQTTLPYMFAVNYKAGGETDPILSYSDEKIGTIAGSEVLGMGLLKKFFWQRLAIMRNGQFYNTWLHLNNNDAARVHHREHKIIKSQKWELVQITDFRPLQSDSTKCFLRKWAPVTEADKNNTYPSEDSVLNANSTNLYDLKYSQLKCLANDIPTPQ